MLVSKSGNSHITYTLTYGRKLEPEVDKKVDIMFVSALDTEMNKTVLDFDSLESIITHEQELRLHTQERLSKLEKDHSELLEKYNILHDFFEAKMHWDLNTKQ